MYANQATISLQIDGVQQDGLINIGQGNIQPSALPGVTTGRVLTFSNNNASVQGRPAARIFAGNYLWYDGTNWNLLMDNTTGMAAATFSGSVVGGANSNATNFMGAGNPSNLALNFTTLASGVSLTTGSSNTAVLGWNTVVPTGQTALIVFSSNSNPLAFDLETNATIKNSKIFLGSAASNPGGQPILLASGANPPLPIVWNGLDSTTGAFVRSGPYTVRVTAEGMSGNAVTQATLSYAVVTQAAILTAAPPSPAGNFQVRRPRDRHCGGRYYPIP